ncbi:MAG: MFS transporter [Pirellula sp.]|nr:MFS transporter [Pirellula sp.]
MTATLPGRTHGLGLITKRVIDDLHFDTVSYATLNFWATMLGALFCLPAGWLIDRLGVVRVALGVVACLALSVLGMSLSRSILAFAMAMILTRGFGQSMLSIVSLSLVGKFYGRDRIGNAMGGFSLVMSLGMAIATGLLAAMVSSMGWRVAWGCQSIALVALAIWLITLRRQSIQQYASTTRTGVENLVKAPCSQGRLTTSTTSRTNAGDWGKALQTPCFWIFTFSISFFGFVSSGVSLFSQYVLEERGFGEGVFQAFLVIGLLSGLVFNVATGQYLKRIGFAGGLSLGMGVLSISMAMVPWLSQLWQVVLYAILFGAAGGILTVVYFSVWRHAFGSTHLGKIQAVAQIPTVFASALGPVFVASMEARTGSYDAVFYVSAFASLVCSVVALLTPVPIAEIEPAVS